MDAKELVRMGLTEYWDGLRKALSGLTATERRFQPHTHANHSVERSAISSLKGVNIWARWRTYGGWDIRPPGSVPGLPGLIPVPSGLVFTSH